MVLQLKSQPFFIVVSCSVAFRYVYELEVNDRDAGSAELYVLILALRLVWHRLQILAYELSEYAVALAVEDAHARHAHEYSVVDKVLHSV